MTNNPIVDVERTNREGRPVLVDSLVAELRTAPAPSVQRAAADLEAAQRQPPKDICPTPRMLAVILAGIVALGFSPLFEQKPTSNMVFRGNVVETQWCDRFGWAQMSDKQCLALNFDTIPLPSLGTCPGSYELWKYNPNKPPVCVKRA